MKLFNIKSRQGSTLIELLIAVMVVGLIVTAVANTVTYSIKNTGESRFRQTATILGQQAIEFIKGEKNRKGLLNLKNSLVSGDYCFSVIPNNLDTTPTSGACNDTNVITMAGTDFKRDVSVITAISSPYNINVKVTVSWTDGNQTRQVELVQELEQAD